jgi:hypothetical protein
VTIVRRYRRANGVVPFSASGFVCDQRGLPGDRLLPGAKEYFKRCVTPRALRLAGRPFA